MTLLCFNKSQIWLLISIMVVMAIINKTSSLDPVYQVGASGLVEKIANKVQSQLLFINTCLVIDEGISSIHAAHVYGINTGYFSQTHKSLLTK